MVVEVWLVHPGCPLEQPSVLLLSWVIIQDMLEPQVPGQDDPHDSGPGLKYPATLEVDGQLLGG